MYCTGFNQERHTGQLLMCFSFQLFVGTKDGHLLMYGVTRKPGGSDHNVQLLRLFCFFFYFESIKYYVSSFVERMKMSDQVKQVLQQEGHHAVGCGARVFHIGGTQGGNGESQN